MIKSFSVELTPQAIEELAKDGDVVRISHDAEVQAGLDTATAAINAPAARAAGTINTPGINPNIITVGAVADRGTISTTDDVIAAFSSRGPTIDGLTKPDLVAPGVDITSLASDTSYLPKKIVVQEVNPGKPLKPSPRPNLRKPLYLPTMLPCRGTSMATPMVAGTVALLLEENPTWTPDKVKKQLISTAVNLGFVPNEQGAGEMNYI